MDYFFLVLILLAFIGNMWVFVCNNKTYKQRTDILYDRSGQYDYDKISYDRHLWLLVTFRNALKRYEVK